MPVFRFSIKSSFPNITRREAWFHMTSMKGVNEELMPFIFMTYPSAANETSVSEAPLNEFLFMSVILLFGLIPIDLHWLRFESLSNFSGFEENSSTLLHRFWRHHRYLGEESKSKLNSQDPDKELIITDDIEFSPRIPFFGYLILPIVKFVFRHRHAQLKKIFSKRCSSKNKDFR